MTNTNHEARVQQITDALNKVLGYLGLLGGLTPAETDRNIYQQATEIVYLIPDALRGGHWSFVLTIADRTLEDTHDALEAQLIQAVLQYKKYFTLATWSGTELLRALEKLASADTEPCVDCTRVTTGMKYITIQSTAEGDPIAKYRCPDCYTTYKNLLQITEYTSPPPQKPNTTPTIVPISTHIAENPVTRSLYNYWPTSTTVVRIHSIYNNHAVCNLPGITTEWPEGHVWVPRLHWRKDTDLDHNLWCPNCDRLLNPKGAEEV